MNAFKIIHKNLLPFSGKKITIKNPSQEQTLTQFLRNDLGLTGTKISCGEGACGACTVTLARPGTGATTLSIMTFSITIN
jgi:xanthine dehydrogenase iron-sulfur cluster and FAD-binding subunit A